MSSRPSTRKVRSVRTRPRSFGSPSLATIGEGALPMVATTRAGADHLAGRGDDRGAGRLADAGLQQHLDAALLEERPRIVAERGRQLAEQAVGELDDAATRTSLRSMLG